MAPPGSLMTWKCRDAHKPPPITKAASTVAATRCEDLTLPSFSGWRVTGHLPESGCANCVSGGCASLEALSVRETSPMMDSV